jgi:hypothetical protein
VASESCIAGFDEAIASERRDRSIAFTGLPELINGIVCMPLTPRRLEWLRATDSPFVCGGKISSASVIQFLWLVSPAFPFDAIQAGRDEFIGKHAEIDDAETLEGIDRYLDAAFLDAPSGKASKPYYSPSAGLYHSLNESYPSGEWTMDKVLDTPLRVIYQLIKAADRANGAIVVNRRSDEVAAKWASSLETLRFPESEVEKQIAIYRAKGYLLVSQPSQNKDGSYSFAMQKPPQD